MKTATFTEFRQNAASYFNDVEKGETIRILRHGKPVADVIPATGEASILSWKKTPLKLTVKGASLSKEIIKERDKSGR